MVTVHKRIRIEGTVKGAGFRPFIYRLALSLGIGGYVRDEEGTVVIEAEGTNLNKFLKKLFEAPPPAVVVERISQEIVPVLGETIFRITGSELLSIKKPLIVADSAPCRNCLEELYDPVDRRYQYPFISCPACGPRFSVYQDLPVDRESTVFASFRMCRHCRAEFNDPLSRRFHHHTISCPDCGPAIWLAKFSPGSERLREISGFRSNSEVILAVREELKRGAVLAVQGISGYQLLASCESGDAVERLIRFNHHSGKPPVILYKDAESVKKDFNIFNYEIEALKNEHRPALLLRPKHTATPITHNLYSSEGEVAVMLPSSVMEHLLVQEMPPMVVVSGRMVNTARNNNIANIPGVYRTADTFLLHNLPMNRRLENSYVRAFQGKICPNLRSRGASPLNLSLKAEFPRKVLAVGGDTNNAFCLAFGDTAVISQHIGSLNDYGTFLEFERSVSHYRHLYRFTPEIMVCDQHPDYISSAWADRQRLPLKRIQHHHAHAGSCLAENNFFAKALTMVLDGGGYGEDGALWGGEFFLGGIMQGFKRVGHIQYYPVPGGDLATREPWRISLALLRRIYGDDWRNAVSEEFLEMLKLQPTELVEEMLRHNLNCRPSSAMGRFFDAGASIILNIPHSRYPGELHIKLETLLYQRYQHKMAFDLEEPPYKSSVSGKSPVILDLDGLIKGVTEDVRARLLAVEVSRRFHISLSSAVAGTAKRLASQYGVDTVALSGGVMQNFHILTWIKRVLEAGGLNVLIHQKVPSGDEGICLGQAVLAEV